MRKVLDILKNAALFLFKDLQWKLLSLVLAYIVWLTGMNVNNPSRNDNYYIPLTFSNVEILESEDIRVLNMDALSNTRIRVNVRAPIRTQESFANSPGAIEASVDLSDVIISDVLTAREPVTKQLDVNVDISLGGERMSTNPKTVNVVLDKYVRRSFDIQVSELGEVDAEHELIDTVSRFNTVVISGAESVVNKVGVVQAQVDIRDARESFTAQAELTVYDGENQDMTGQVELSVPETSVRVTVYPQKEVPLSIGHTGSLAYNYVITDTILTPETVTVIGLPEDLAGLEGIELEPLDLTNHNATLNTSVDIRSAVEALGSSVRLRSGEQTGGAVTYTIEPLRPREFLFPSRDIRIVVPSGLAVRLVEQGSVPITVLGPDSEMSGMTVSRIGAQLNLSELGVGEHSVPLHVTLPEGMTTAGTPMVDAVITEAAAEFPAYPLTDPETGLPADNPPAGTDIDPETGEPAEPAAEPAVDSPPEETADDAVEPTENISDEAGGGAITGGTADGGADE